MCRKKIYGIILGLCLPAFLLAQSSNQITGYWLTQDDDSQVKIFRKSNGKYYGKIVWLEEPNNEYGQPKKDTENPDESKCDQTLLGLPLLEGFEYDEDDERWEEGTIYDPTEGKTYDCLLWFEDNNTNVLHLKGYVGFSMLGREVKWTRESNKRK